MNSVYQISKTIKLLPEHLIDQIKAGEVVERPASVIKELVENSIDSNATKIDIHVVANGLELISVIDNGSGMAYDDLTYAFCRHATSKISKFEDLYSINSFGFRGEALASIASSSRVTCISSNKHSGGKIEIFGGESISHVKNGLSSSCGTSIFVRDLFYNTPVRFKFVKSKTAEKNSIKRIVNGFIISNPSIEFSVKFDDNDKDIFKKTDGRDIKDRVLTVFKIGKKESSTDSVIEVRGEYGDYAVSGFVSLKGSRGKNSKSQFLMINGRFFEDRSLYQAILKGMGQYWFPGESGHYYISITARPSDIDVNVHPNKTHIKFKDPAILFSLVQSSIKNSIPIVENSPLSAANNFAAGDNSVDWSKFSENEYSYEDKCFHEEKNNNNNYKVSEQYMLVEHSGVKYFCDLYKMVGQYVKDELIENFPIKDENISPLLISNICLMEWTTVEKFKDELKRFGFEIEKVSDSKIIFKAVPTCLEFIAESSCMSAIVRSLVDKDKNVVDLIRNDLLVAKCNLTSHQFNKIWEVIIKNRNHFNSSTIKMTDLLIGNLFAQGPK